MALCYVSIYREELSILVSMLSTYIRNQSISYVAYFPVCQTEV